MRKTNYTYFMVLFLVFVSAILFASVGCGKTEQPKEPKPKETVSSQTPTENEFFVEYSKLTKEKFADIRSGTTPFSSIMIVYTNDIESNEPKELDQENKVQDLVVFTGKKGGSENFESIIDYKGFLDERPASQPSKAATLSDDIDYKVIFSVDEVNLIYDFIDTYPNYFYGNEKLNELKDSFISHKIHIDDEGYCFTLAIYEAGSNTKAWVLSKCMEEPDPILEELIKILQDNFIDDFKK